MLDKLPPLPNQTTYETPPLIQARTEYQYLYIVNWLHHFRGYIRLASEYFDVDLFELELVGFFGETAPFTDKLRMQLAYQIQNTKLASILHFDEFVRTRFRLLSEDESYLTLDVSSKLQVLYHLICHVTRSVKFRDYIDKQGLSMQDLRVSPISHESNGNEDIDYFVLGEGTRMYRRTIKYPSMAVPKRRIDEEPEHSYDVEVKFELIYKNMAELEAYVSTLGKGPVRNALTNKRFVERAAAAEAKARRYLQNRKKEVQLENLLATRKRSSRIEKRQHERLEYEQRLQEEREEELRMEEMRRLERRREVSERGTRSMERLGGELTREERLRLRRVH